MTTVTCAMGLVGMQVEESDVANAEKRAGLLKDLHEVRHGVKQVRHLPLPSRATTVPQPLPCRRICRQLGFHLFH